MEPIIREPNIDDAGGIAVLSNQLGYASSVNKTSTRLLAILNSAENCAYVAVDHGVVIGWIHGLYALRMESDPFVEIGGLVIDASYRRKGIGRILVQKVMEWSHLKDVNTLRVRCNTVRKESHQFYKDLGFEETKEQKVFSRAVMINDRVWLVKDVDNKRG